MVLRPRRAHQCVLPAVPDPVPRSALLAAHHPQRQLGLYMGRQHALPRRVRLLPPLTYTSLLLMLAVCRFTQYTYGMYLGLNGQSPRPIATHLQPLTTLAQPFRSSFAQSCFSRRYCRSLRGT